MLRHWFAEIVLGVGLVAAFLVWPTQVPADNVRKTAPNFTLSDAQGAAVRLSDYKGKGLSVIGVSMDDDGWKSVKPFVEEQKMNYAVVIGNEALAKLYAVDALPVTLLIDRSGKIAVSHAGMVEKDAFEKEIQALLQDSAKNISK